MEIAMKLLGFTALALSLSVPVFAGGECTVKDAAGKSACAPGAKLEASAVEKVDEATLSTDALAALIRSGTKLTILDARSGKYDDGRRIPGAKSLASSADNDTIFATAGDKSGLVVTYCSNLKCPASKRLATKLRKLGYTNVVEYPNGIDGWAQAGKTVVKVDQT
jgi:rhodanese-related sulfurtransferase